MWKTLRDLGLTLKKCGSLDWASRTVWEPVQTAGTNGKLSWLQTAVVPNSRRCGAVKPRSREAVRRRRRA